VYRVAIIASLAVILATGFYATTLVGDRWEASARADLLGRSALAASAINPDRILTQTATPDDVGTADYQRLHEQLTLMDGVSKDVRWIYLMMLKDGAIVFTVDGIPRDDPGHTEPGVAYEAPPEELMGVFAGNAATVGPYTDEFGTFISGFTPIRDLKNGRTLAVLGIDTQAGAWFHALALARLTPILVTLLLCLIVFGAAVALERSRLAALTIAESERDYRTVLETMQDGFYRANANGDLLLVSPEYALTVENSAEALLTIINDILDFSKIEAGKLEMETLDFDLRRTLEDTVDLPALHAHDKGLELTALVEADVPSALRGDPGRLRQVLTNIVGNAIKFTERGEVAVNVGLVDDRETSVTLRFEVRDTGMGIPAEKVDLLFEAFTQADASTTRRFGGTGLGLTISRRLVELMHGQSASRASPAQDRRSGSPPALRSRTLPSRMPMTGASRRSTSPARASSRSTTTRPTAGSWPACSMPGAAGTPRWMERSGRLQPCARRAPRAIPSASRYST
jgi:signal transduction histidine kinase